MNTNIVIAQWRDWNTDRTLSSDGRKKNKIQSLQGFAKDLAGNDEDLSDRVEGITQEFFKFGLDSGKDGVKNMLNFYCNRLPPEFVKELAPLIEEAGNTLQFT